MKPVGVVTRGGHWVVDLLDDIIMKYLNPLDSVLFGTIIPTFFSIFVIVFYSCFFLQNILLNGIGAQRLWIAPLRLRARVININELQQACIISRWIHDL